MLPKFSQFYAETIRCIGISGMIHCLLVIGLLQIFPAVAQVSTDPAQAIVDETDP